MGNPVEISTPFIGDEFEEYLSNLTRLFEIDSRIGVKLGAGMSIMILMELCGLLSRDIHARCCSEVVDISLSSCDNARDIGRAFVILFETDNSWPKNFDVLIN